MKKGILSVFIYDGVFPGMSIVLWPFEGVDIAPAMRGHSSAPCGEYTPGALGGGLKTRAMDQNVGERHWEYLSKNSLGSLMRRSVPERNHILSGVIHLSFCLFSVVFVLGALTGLQLNSQVPACLGNWRSYDTRVTVSIYFGGVA